MAESSSDTEQMHDESRLNESLISFSDSPGRQQEAGIRSRLGTYLSKEWIGPDTAFVEHIQNPINPGMFVKDAETIGLPLSYRDASALFDISDKLEKLNDETMGEKVRTAWTLPPSSISFQNPAFRAWVVESTKKVIEGLRISGRVNLESIRVHFSGMVLQPPCASNEPLRLAPSIKNAFAMMAIVLPTAHTGGNVQFMSGEDVKQYETAEASAYDCSLLSWLTNSDVEVVLGSIESGCRVMLTYDLFSAEKVQFPSLASAQTTHELLYKTLLDFKRSPEASGKIPGVFVHALKHTSDTLFPISDSLQAHDKDLVRVLQCVSAEIGLLVYLANIQRKVRGRGLNDDKNFHMETIISDSVQLNQIFDFDGTKMAHLVKIEEQNLVQDFSEAFGDWASNGMNEGGVVSLMYDRFAVLLIVPSCYPGLLLNPDNEGRVDAGQWLSQAIHAAVNSSPGHISREQLRHGCRYITAQYKAHLDGTRPMTEPSFSDQDIALVIKASILTGELDLSFGLEKLTPESHLDIGTFITMHGFAGIEDSLSIGMSKLPKFSTRRHIINELETNVLAASSVQDPLIENAMGIWREKQAEEALRDCIYETSDEAHCLILMGARHGSHFLLTKILSMVRQHVKSTTFVLNFLNHLALGASELNIPRAAVRLCFQVLLPEITPRLLLLGTKRKNSMRNRSLRLASAPKLDHLSAQYATPEQIAEVMVNCLEFSINSGLDTLVKQLLDEESTSKGSNLFENVYLPFLKHLLSLIKELQTWKNKTRRVSREVPDYQQSPGIKKLFEKLAKRHLRRLNAPNPPLPPNPTNWVKDKMGCKEDTCRDCKRLDRFLPDPLRRHEQFKASAARRKHIEHQVRGITSTSDSHNPTTESNSKTEFRFKLLQDPYPGILIVEKTHKDWESQIFAWSQKCEAAMEQIERELVAPGGATLLGNVSTLMGDLRELIGVKLRVTELCTDLCVKESRWASLSSGRES